MPGRILTIASQFPASDQHRGDDGPGAPWPEAGEDDPLWRVAQVDFGGVRQQVSLACLPEAQVGDQVLVHVGLAISLVQEDGADADGDAAEPLNVEGPGGMPQP